MAYYQQNLGAVRDVLPLIATVIFTMLVAWILHDWLFTLAGSIAGMLGIEGYVTAATSRIRTIGAILGGTFGAIIDGYSNFTGAVIAGALSGDVSCICFLMGYIVLFGVIIMNYLTTGKFVR